MFCSSASAHPGREDEEAPPADFLYDEAGETVDAAVFDNPRWYDADVVSSGGALWYAWLEFTPGKGDRVWVGSRDGGKWTPQNEVSGRFGNYARPTLTVDAAGTLWLSYEAEGEDRSWNVFAVPLGEGKPSGKARRISPGGGADIRHRVAADSDGGLWFVWQSDRGGQFDVLARKVNGDAAEETVTIGDSPHGDWHPSIAVGPEGEVCVAWDAYDGESFNVRLRALRGGGWGKMVDVAAGAAFEGRAQVAIDKAGRVWVAWEVGGRNWGKPYRGINTAGVRDDLGPLHRFRALKVAWSTPTATCGRCATRCRCPPSTGRRSAK